MIILAKAIRKKDGSIDVNASADLRGVREQDVLELKREGGGKILVRLDDGEPAEYYDAVNINGDALTSDELKAAFEGKIEQRERKPRKGGESWPKSQRC